MNMSYMCKYNIDEVCTNYNCDECKQHPMYKQGAKEFAEWLLSNKNINVGHDSFYLASRKVTLEELMSVWEKGAEE